MMLTRDNKVGRQLQPAEAWPFSPSARPRALGLTPICTWKSAITCFAGKLLRDYWTEDSPVHGQVVMCRRC